MTLPILKPPNHPDPAFGVALGDYLKQFEYKITLKLGSTYSSEFKEFTEWCQTRLGTKYKDWFLYNSSKGEYVLFCRNNKWATFLALTHVDKIV